jgi:hypothetical protein
MAARPHASDRANPSPNWKRFTLESYHVQVRAIARGHYSDRVAVKSRPVGPWADGSIFGRFAATLARRACSTSVMPCPRLLLLGLLLLFCVDARADAGSEPANPPGRMTFAVIVGNNQSLGRRRPELHYADDDAARYFEIFQTMAPGRVSLLADFDRDTARLFPNAKAHASSAKRHALDAVGQRLASEARAARAAGHEVEVYFVFAGHGDVAQGGPNSCRTSAYFCRPAPRARPSNGPRFNRASSAT